MNIIKILINCVICSRPEKGPGKGGAKENDDISIFLLISELSQKVINSICGFISKMDEVGFK